jgi:hypothetical protein
MVELVENRILAFASDTQAPMFVETLLLKQFRNKEATRLLFGDVRKRSPKLFFHLGDVVNLGYSQRQWNLVDPFLEKIREDGIGLYAIMGNHEVMGRPLTGERMFQQRFPDHKRTGFMVRFEEIAVLMLNSNFSSLSFHEQDLQVSWLQATLNELDADPSVQSVITCCHHSPFTNSRIVKPSVAVQKQFVPVFQASKKGQLFLSGHAHAFEHFMVGGKDFMVIGGGGGLKQPLRKGIGSLTDLSGDYKPMFHYLTLYYLADQLKITSWHLNKEFSGFEEGLKLDIKKQPKLEGSIVIGKGLREV